MNNNICIKMYCFYGNKFYSILYSISPAQVCDDSEDFLFEKKYFQHFNLIRTVELTELSIHTYTIRMLVDLNNVTKSKA